MISMRPAPLIVNQTLARLVFRQRQAVGERLIFTGDDSTPYEIVGVVGDEKINGLDAQQTPIVYYPYLQDSSPGTSRVVVARTEVEPASLAAIIRNESQALESGVTISDVRPMRQVIADTPATFMRRYPALLIGVFALLALVLAAVGIYGVISYTVNQQTHDIGVRMALGAQRRDVLRLVLGRAALLSLAGVSIGVVAALALTRLMQGLLFGVTAHDLATFALVTPLLFVISLLACLLPARRATKVDPMVALRYE